VSDGEGGRIHRGGSLRIKTERLKLLKLTPEKGRKDSPDVLPAKKIKKNSVDLQSEVYPTDLLSA
jgi:hypothetical protein